MAAQINKDAFLKSQGIEVEGSDFLRRNLSNKAKGIKEEYDARDLHGLRLSHNWQPGDTVMSVALKIMKHRFVKVLDPDTYTIESMKTGREEIKKQRVKIFGLILCLALPLTLYVNFLKPRLDRVKRLYYMQFYNKMGFFSRELGVKTKEVSQKDLEDSV